MNTAAVIKLPDLQAMKRFATRFATVLKAKDVILLRGDLGSGKTTLARTLLQSLGVEGDVPSPTFTLIQTYETPKGPLAHFDLYRLKSPTDIEEIGFDEACASGIVVVEWPEKAASYMPQEALTLLLRVASGTHEIEVQAPPSWLGRVESLVNAN